MMMVAAAVGLAVAEPASVTIRSVASSDPWNAAKGDVSVTYAVGGIDPTLDYKVAFDVTANGVTRGVTNAAQRLSEGDQPTQTIGTTALFGHETVDAHADLKVTLIAVKPVKPASAGVQLWANGPFWAECNVGAKAPVDYGELYTFNDNKAADAAKSLGDGWRLPTDRELNDLLSNCTKNWETCKDGTGADINGYRFTGKGDYSSNSIFLPAAGFNSGSGRDSAGDSGHYWSSEASDVDLAWCLLFSEGGASVLDDNRSYGCSVRAVRSAE